MSEIRSPPLQCPLRRAPQSTPPPSAIPRRANTQDRRQRKMPRILEHRGHSWDDRQRTCSQRVVRGTLRRRYVESSAPPSQNFWLSCLLRIQSNAWNCPTFKTGGQWPACGVQQIKIWAGLVRPRTRSDFSNRPTSNTTTHKLRHDYLGSDLTSVLLLFLSSPIPSCTLPHLCFTSNYVTVCQ